MIIKNWKMDFCTWVGLDCSAPCDMYSVLYDHKLISDPYYGTNEEYLRELSKNNSCFYTEFSLNEDELRKEKIERSFSRRSSVVCISDLLVRLNRLRLQRFGKICL